MAKSVLHACWDLFQTMLQYKCDYAGVWFHEVEEAYSIQTCSCCKRRTGPEGMEGLGIREWVCLECGTYHQLSRKHSYGATSWSCRRPRSLPRLARQPQAEGGEDLEARSQGLGYVQVRR
jgi:Putative transposase DNA-binding domain